ncbi:filamentous hemagglutinin N-terminal domain-containing protein [Leptothoe sp. LEGE 181152]|nr:filamentous hemagglutinin N-terminal domain-containing protein [Leptothoe sp. LEGE 181152]
MVFVTPLATPPPVIALVDPLASPVDVAKVETRISDTLLAQAVIPEGATNVEVDNAQITISGGEQAGSNLFYGFEQFNVPPDATADFLANPAVQRVIGHVTGGNSSTIDGLLTITGGSADLFIINPAGVLFGPNARLDLPATFTATTAHGLSFGDQWFDITGENTIQELGGTPSGLAFSEASGAIVNLADLSVDGGLMLAAGTVIDLGSLQSVNGAVQVLSQDSGTVALQEGLLRLDLTTAALPEELGGTTVSLADLLTGGMAEQAAAITVDAEGNVALGNIAIAPGDSILRQVNGQTALLVAQNNLHLPGSQVNTAEAATLIGEHVHITDSASQPLNLDAGGRLTIQGDDSIDILALYNDQTSITGGNVVLASNGEISLDAHIGSTGDVQFTTLDQQSANFISLYDPIISADGNVSFGSYSGPALKIEATGSIIANGDITITSADTTLSPFLNWESIGEVLLETSQFGTGPTPAPSQVLLDSGTNAVSQAQLETFLGLAPGSLDGLGSGDAVNGAGIRATFTAQAGDTVSFDWNFVTDQDPGLVFDDNDFAVVVLSGTPTVLADTGFPDGSSSGLTASPEAFENFGIGFFSFDFGTGTESFSTTVPADGSYTLGIALVNEDSAFDQSLLLVDNVTPEPVLISDESLLATSRALILRAGETVLQNSANVPQLDVPTLDTDFVETGMGNNPPSINVDGNIFTGDTGFSESGGPVILSAPGTITVNGDINTASNASGDIAIAGGEINTGRLIAGGGFENTSSVNLTASNGDIVVETISAGGGGVDIDAAGLFQATDTFETSVRITLDPVEDAALIAFLQEVDAEAFSQIDLNEQIQILIPASIATSPDSGNGLIRIRHGATGNTVSDGNYDIQGTGTVSSTPFFVGPNPENVTITINPEGSSFQATVSGFTPLFSDTEFPSDASGTNGAIAQLTGDGSLATAFFNEPFVPEVPGTDPGPTPGPGLTPGPRPGPQPTEPSGPEFSTADTDNLEETEDGETVATESDADNLLALRGTAEECDADTVTQEDGVTQLLGDCLEENNGEANQSSIPIEQIEQSLDVAPDLLPDLSSPDVSIDDVTSRP